MKYLGIFLSLSVAGVREDALRKHQGVSSSPSQASSSSQRLIILNHKEKSGKSTFWWKNS